MHCRNQAGGKLLGMPRLRLPQPLNDVQINFLSLPGSPVQLHVSIILKNPIASTAPNDIPLQNNFYLTHQSQEFQGSLAAHEFLTEARLVTGRATGKGKCKQRIKVTKKAEEEPMNP